MKIVGTRKLIMCILGLIVFLVVALHNANVNYFALGSGILMVIGPAVIANFGEYLTKWKSQL